MSFVFMSIFNLHLHLTSLTILFYFIFAISVIIILTFLKAILKSVDTVTLSYAVQIYGEPFQDCY